ncbi:alpha/beta fold hydrolase [Bradyrhizobium sp. RT5a]|uniref:lipase family alpha/beta hydrolase n=1 Tax=unclassified Bradyrhizobium TaxID=2631580 RepID=UPI0033936E64
MRLNTFILVVLAVVTCSPTANAQGVRIIEWSRGRSPIAVLFLHGIGGCAVPSGKTAQQSCADGAIDSFRNTQATKSWPELVASDDYRLANSALREILPRPLRMEDLGVWGVDYSRLTTSGCPTFSVAEAARLIRAQIEASKLYEKYEQVIIVAHSMGGLITKNMLLSWQVGNDKGGMLARTIGVFLLGVPSQGSDLAPGGDIKQALLKTLQIDKLANICDRQVKDMFAGNDNTFLHELERNWEQLLGSRRDLSQSQAPLVYCAYETIPEPVVGRYLSVTPVKQLYAHTQCSDEQMAIPQYHTMLPKPLNAQDDVHRAWLSVRLDDLFRKWSKWEFIQFAFLPSDSFDVLAAQVNRNQDAFVLDVSDLKSAKPSVMKFVAPNNFALVAKVARANNLCVDEEWPAGGKGHVWVRPAGKCQP